MFEPVKQIKVYRSFIIILPDQTHLIDMDVGSTNCGVFQFSEGPFARHALD